MRFFIALLFMFPVVASATHDVGDSLSVIRMSANGKHLLVVRCDVQGEFHEIFVRTTTSPNKIIRLTHKAKSLKGGVIKQLPFGTEDEAYEICSTPKIYLAKAKREPLLGVLKKYALHVTPVRGQLAPSKDRYIFIKSGERTLQPRIIEGKKVRNGGQAVRVVRDGPQTQHFSTRFLWHPNGRLAVLEINASQGFEDAVFSWASTLRPLAFNGPSKRPLAKDVVAIQLNSEGYRRDKAARKHMGPEPSESLKLYVEAMKWNPKYETAIYNTACMHALMNNHEKALATLQRLKTLNTNKARTKLKRAPKDSDFASMLKIPRFVKLTTL